MILPSSPFLQAKITNVQKESQVISVFLRLWDALRKMLMQSAPDGLTLNFFDLTSKTMLIV
jgi:hypothetical protein